MVQTRGAWWSLGSCKATLWIWTVGLEWIFLSGPRYYSVRGTGVYLFLLCSKAFWLVWNRFCEIVFGCVTGLLCICCKSTTHIGTGSSAARVFSSFNEWGADSGATAHAEQVFGVNVMYTFDLKQWSQSMRNHFGNLVLRPEPLWTPYKLFAFVVSEGKLHAAERFCSLGGEGGPINFAIRHLPRSSKFFSGCQPVLVSVILPVCLLFIPMTPRYTNKKICWLFGNDRGTGGPMRHLDWNKRVQFHIQHWKSKRHGGMKIQPKFNQSWSCMGQIEPTFATPVILMYVAIWYRSGQRTSMVKYQGKQNFNDWFYEFHTQEVKIQHHHIHKDTSHRPKLKSNSFMIPPVLLETFNISRRF